MVFSVQIESLGGFKIVHEVEDGEEVVFRFHARSKLQGGAAVTVSYCGDAGLYLEYCVYCDAGLYLE